MNAKRVILLSVCVMLLAPPTGHAIEEFFGTIESRPKNGDSGTWVIGGRKLEVTDKALLEEDHGPFVVGACVEVEIKGSSVLEMSTEDKRDCKK